MNEEMENVTNVPAPSADAAESMPLYPRRRRYVRRYSEPGASEEMGEAPAPALPMDTEGGDGAANGEARPMRRVRVPRRYQENATEEIRRLSSEELLFCAIPLFYEIGWKAEPGTKVISSWCDEVTQLERLKARGWSETEIAHRLASQISRDEKLRRADYGIITSCSWECLGEQCRRVHQALLH